MDEADRRLFQLYRGFCAHCHLRVAVCIHEIKPRSLAPRGAWQALDNRVPLCHHCHDHITSSGTVTDEELLDRAKELMDLWAENT